MEDTVLWSSGIIWPHLIRIHNWIFYFMVSYETICKFFYVIIHRHVDISMSYFKKILPERKHIGRSLWWTITMLVIVMFFIVYLNTISQI